MLPYNQKNEPIRPLSKQDIDFQRKIICRPLVDEFEIFKRILFCNLKALYKLYRMLQKARRYIEKRPRYRGLNKFRLRPLAAKPEVEFAKF